MVCIKSIILFVHDHNLRPKNLILGYFATSYQVSSFECDEMVNIYERNDKWNVLNQTTAASWQLPRTFTIRACVASVLTVWSAVATVWSIPAS
jgi:hypothetical protein